jgi:hypothetical protein
VAYLILFSEHSPLGTDGNYGNLRIVGVPSEIRTEYCRKCNRSSSLSDRRK